MRALCCMGVRPAQRRGHPYYCFAADTWQPSTQPDATPEAAEKEYWSVAVGRTGARILVAMILSPSTTTKKRFGSSKVSGPLQRQVLTQRGPDHRNVIV
jgi:hypothetical protein